MVKLGKQPLEGYAAVLGSSDAIPSKKDGIALLTVIGGNPMSSRNQEKSKG